MKTALVTGSSRSIGKAIALQLAHDGYNIFVHYKKENNKALQTQAEIEKLGQKAYLVQADVTADNDLKKMFEEINKITDTLDVVVNNVGFDYAYMIEDYTLEQINYMINVNLISKMMITKYALPFLMKSKTPTIINIASRMGKEKTIETVGAYAPAEAGIIKFTQCCALEFSKYSIRVNCVAPGLTRTGLTENIFKTEGEWEAFSKKNPSHRVGMPQDVANVVSFLASDKSSYINGETLGVNGGSNLG